MKRRLLIDLGLLIKYHGLAFLITVIVIICLLMAYAFNMSAILLLEFFFIRIAFCYVIVKICAFLVEIGPDPNDSVHH